MDSILKGTVKSRVPMSNDFHNAHWRDLEMAVVAINNSGDVSAVIKKVSEKELVAEVACALLGLHIGLPIPKPMIVKDRGTGDLFFGSEKVEHPDLRRYQKPVELLKNWVLLNKASVFDEWIANEDRHDGNLLTDGSDFWLIDHESALDVSIVRYNDPLDNNQLLNVASDNNDHTGLVASFKEITDDMLNNFANLHINKLPPDIKIFITKRLPNVFSLLENKVPIT